MLDFTQRTNVTVDFLSKLAPCNPVVAIILGTGLGGMVADIEDQVVIPYSSIPHFPVSTVESHSGNLIFGRISGKDVVVMQGRFHVYEGYSAQEISFPVRVMKLLGAKTLVVSNACGCMNPDYRRGDVMLMDDHINLLGVNPLIGPNVDEWGPRFPDMSEPYSKRLMSLAHEVAAERKIDLKQGVYVAVAGPNLETRAEYRFLHRIGADVVGMSTVPENIVARHMSMEVLGLSVVTDECFPDSLQAVTLEHVLAAARLAEPKLTAIIKGVIEKL